MFYGLLDHEARQGRRRLAYVAIDRLYSLPNVTAVTTCIAEPTVCVCIEGEDEPRVFTAKKSFTVAACRALAALGPQDT